jgi:hypothetical protein
MTTDLIFRLQLVAVYLIVNAIGLKLLHAI